MLAIGWERGLLLPTPHFYSRERMILYLMGLVDVLASVFIVFRPSLSVLVLAVIIGLLYKFAVSVIARGVSVKMFAIADLLAAVALYTGMDFGPVGWILIIIHLAKGFMSFMGLPLLRDATFALLKASFRAVSRVAHMQNRKGGSSLLSMPRSQEKTVLQKKPTHSFSGIIRRII